MKGEGWRVRVRVRVRVEGEGEGEDERRGSMLLTYSKPPGDNHRCQLSWPLMLGVLTRVVRLVPGIHSELEGRELGLRVMVTCDVM